MNITIAGQVVCADTLQLELNDKGIHDLTPLCALTKLTKLELQGNPVTISQVDELRRALPNCEVLF